ncbi:MAG: sugar ABC transporter substrate-binding protein [Anaerolineae bacterium]|nr:sugar ABC transporter substrate-binding protein [Anaerolineae bacterium]
MSARRGLGLRAFFILLAIVLAGCCESGPVVPTLEPAAITFFSPYYEAEYYQLLADEFNDIHPDIHVQVESARGQEYPSDFYSVDVFVGSQLYGVQLQAQGDILDMSPFIEHDLAFDPSDFLPGTLEAFSSEDAVWAIPFGIDPLVMYYNRDLFDAAGAAYPQTGWTWEDFLDAALAVNDPEANVFGYVSTPQSNDPIPFIYQHGGKILDDPAEPTRTTFDDPLTIEAVEWYADLIHEYNVIPTSEQQRSAFPGANGTLQGIAHGRVGMWIGALSERGGMTWQRQRWEMNWGVAPLPRDVQSMTLADVRGYYISAHTQYHEACWQWVTFVSKQPYYRLAPAHEALLYSEEYEEEVGSRVAAAARASIEHAVLVTPRLAAFGQVLEEAFLPAIESVIEGATPEEAMIAAQGQAEMILGQ